MSRLEGCLLDIPSCGRESGLNVLELVGDIAQVSRLSIMAFDITMGFGVYLVPF
jgi:hypothetical protein